MKTYAVFAKDYDKCDAIIAQTFPPSPFPVYEDSRTILTNKGLRAGLEDYNNFVDFVDNIDGFITVAGEVIPMNSKENNERFSELVSKVSPGRKAMLCYSVRL